MTSQKYLITLLHVRLSSDWAVPVMSATSQPEDVAPLPLHVTDGFFQVLEILGNGTAIIDIEGAKYEVSFKQILSTYCSMMATKVDVK